MRKCKQVISMILVLAMMFAIFSVGVVQSGAAENNIYGDYPIPLLGDVNRDGRVDTNDVYVLRCSIVRRSGYLRYDRLSSDSIEFRIANCYVDSDMGLPDRVDTNDVWLLRNYILHRRIARDKGIGEPLKELPTEPQPTEPQPTEPQPTDAPEPTEAPTEAPLPTEPLEGLYLRVAADKTTAEPGDTVNFTVILGPTDGIANLQMVLDIPEGLTFVAGSGKLVDGAKEKMGFDSLNWTEQSRMINGTVAYPDYVSDEETPLATFSCTVDEGFTGEASVSLKRLELGNWMFEDLTDRYTVYPAVIRVQTDVPTEAPAPTDPPTEAPKPTDPPKPTQPPTDPPVPTQAPTDPPKPTDPPTEAPKPTEAPQGAYYLVGTMTDWQVDANYKLVSRDGTDSLFWYEGLNVQPGDQFKVVYSENGTTAARWFPEGIDNNFGQHGEIPADCGVCDVYFRPNYDGGDDFFAGCIKIEYLAVPTEAPTQPPVPTEPAEKSYLKVAADKTTAEPGDTVNFTVILGPTDGIANLQMVLDIPEGLTFVAGSGKLVDGAKEKMGFDSLNWTEQSRMINGTVAYPDYVSDDETPLATFSCTVDAGFTGEARVSLKNLELGNWLFEELTDRYTVVPAVIKVQKDAPTDPPKPTQAPTDPPKPTEPPTEPPKPTEPPTEAPTEPAKVSYYLVGSMNDWTISDSCRLTAVDGASTEEYTISADLTTTSQFKIVSSEDGSSISKWFPEGMGNNYGENGEIKTNGTYEIYFRPNYDGNDDWFSSVIYAVCVAQPTEAPTDPPAPTQAPTDPPKPTQAPTDPPKPTEPPTEPPKPTEPPTEAPTEPAKVSYYLVGSMNDWTISDSCRLTAVDGASTEEYTISADLTTTSQFKIISSEDGSSIAKWFPEGMGNNYGENGEITVNGTYDIYFRPNYDGNDDWFSSVIYAVCVAQPTEAPTDPPAPTQAPTDPPKPTQAPTDPPKPTEPPTEPPKPTDPPTEAPTEPAKVSYYLVGSMNDWTISDSYQLTAVADASAEEYTISADLTTTSQFKIVSSEDGSSISKWFPEGMGNNYGENGEITVNGTYDIYFRPNYDGNDDWFSSVIYAVCVAQPTEAPTEPPKPTHAVDLYLKVVPEKSEVTTGEIITFTVILGPTDGIANIQFDLDIPLGLNYVSGTGALAEGVKEKMGFDSLDWTEKTKRVNGTRANGNYTGTEETPLLTFSCFVSGSDKTVDLGLTNLELGDYHFGNITNDYEIIPASLTISSPAPTEAPTDPPVPTQAPTDPPKPTEPPTEAPKPTEPPTEAPKPTEPPTEAPTEPAKVSYYLVGSMNDWTISDSYKLTAVADASAEEYTISADLTTTSQFKIVSSEDGAAISKWFPEGMGNNYGENGEIKTNGTYEIYFRPNYDGNDDWFSSVIYAVCVAQPTEAPTDPPKPTQAPTTAPQPTESTEPYLKVVAENSEAETGDIITFTVVLGPTDGIANIQFDLDIPAGLVYVSNSGALSSGVRDKMGYDSLDWTEKTRRVNGTRSDGNYVSADETVLLTFRCYVSGTGETVSVGLKNLELGDWMFEEITDLYKIIPAEVTIKGQTATEAPTDPPAPTQAPTDPPKPTESPKAKITVVGLKGQSETKEIGVGESFAVYTVLNTSQISGGKIGSLKGAQLYNPSVLQLVDAYSTVDGNITDLDAMFPVTKQSTVADCTTAGTVNFYASVASVSSNMFMFDTDASLLMVSHYTVTAAEEATISIEMNTLAVADAELTRIIDRGEIVNSSFTLSSSFTEPASVPVQPTAVPQPTQAPTVTNETAQITVTGLDGASETRTYRVGESFTVRTTLNASQINSGRIASIRGGQMYTGSVLKLADAYSAADGTITDLNKVFPVTGSVTSSNGGKAGALYFLASTPSISNAFVFDSDDSELLVSTYTVTAAGTATISMDITTLASADEDLTRIIDKGVVLNSKFTMHSAFAGAVPATEAPTQAPTQAQKKYIYFAPGIWDVSDVTEKYQLYIWNDSGDSMWLPSLPSRYLYEFDIPDGYTYAIFTRMDPSKPADTWSSVWNQTEDITLSGNLSKTFTIDSWTGGKDGKSSGHWY